MTRDEAAEALRAIAEDLEADVRLCQTRDQHVRMSRRLADVRALLAGLAAA